MENIDNLEPFDTNQIDPHYRSLQWTYALWPMLYGSIDYGP